MEIDTINRRQLFDILLSIPGAFPQDSAISEPRFEFDQDTVVGIIWKDGTSNPRVPGLIVIESSKQRDFFAWASSFVPALRPFSAFFRVIDEITASTISELELRPLDPKLVSGLIGLAIAEAISYKSSTKLIGNVVARECTGTSSFCLGRSLFMGLPHRTQDVLDAWGTAKELIENRRPSFFDELHFLWNIVALLATRESQRQLTIEQEVLLICCKDILEEGEIAQINLRRLTGRSLELVSLKVLVDGTREERVLALDGLLSSVVRSSESSQDTKAFICGYLTSLIAPGTMDHMGLLASINQILPTAPMWYGFCAGLKGNDGRYLYSANIGRRVMRELTRRIIWTDPPTCDIAVGELIVVMTSSRSIPDYLRTGVGFIEIEVAPGVICSLRYPSLSRDDAEASRSIPQAELRRLQERLTDIAHRVDETQREIHRISGGHVQNRETKPKPRKTYP
jgi:hypothetical protein